VELQYRIGGYGPMKHATVMDEGPQKDYLTIMAFAFEEIDGRRQVGFGFANLASSRERLEEALVRPLIERRELEPCVEVHERLVVGAAHGELLEAPQCDSCEADDAVPSARRKTWGCRQSPDSRGIPR
jgi:hypothetical protein